MDPKVEEECLKKNEEWESWKRKHNITHYKPAKRPKVKKADSPSSSSSSSSISPKANRTTPGSTKGKGGRRGLKTKKTSAEGGKLFEARLAKMGKKNNAVICDAGVVD